MIEDATQIIVTLIDHRQFKADLVGSDAQTDLAVLQIEVPDLVGLSLSDSDQLQIGDVIIAIGNPFGLAHTVTSGIISALGRTGLTSEGYEDFIQIDASIHPGSSGRCVT